MKREDIIVLILGLLLLAGMLWTLLFGGGQSRHGVGSMQGIFPTGNQGRACKQASARPHGEKAKTGCGPKRFICG